MSEGKKGLLERLAEGVVVGDGGFTFALERRGYTKGGPWTPECTVENPEAVRQLHREFLRAGSDVMQAFTFYASDSKLAYEAHHCERVITSAEVTAAGSALAREVAAEGGALTAGSISQVYPYTGPESRATIYPQFVTQVNTFTSEKLDFIICEYFANVQEIEWAIEAGKASGKPVAASLNIGPEGDMGGVSPGDCAVRMARAGADVVGVNCHFDPTICLKTVRLMKAGLEAADLHPYLMVQPVGFWTPDAGKEGYISIPEFPFAIEPRTLTRYDMQHYAREAYELGVRYIGGCCGFEPYHIRAVCEELAPERGRLPAGSSKHEPWGAAMKTHGRRVLRERTTREYWENMQPATGRAHSAAYSQAVDTSD